MIDLSPPPVPRLPDNWVALRRRHLVNEITAPPAHRRLSRRVISGVVALTASVTGVLVGVFGLAAPAAFAGWSAAPTTPSPGQTQTAEAACAARLQSVGAAYGSPSPALIDTRGPFTLTVFASPANVALCVNGPSFTSVQPNEPSPDTTPPPNDLALGHASFTSRAGSPYGFVDGTVGSNVTGVALNLSDGTSVVTTVANGRFAAWWPGTTGIATVSVTSPGGTVTRPIDISVSSASNGPETSTGSR